MAEIVLDCPACKQPIQADEAWAGQQIECPLCRAPMMVPESTGRHVGATPGQMRLSAGGTQPARSASGGATARTFQKKSAKQQSPVAKYAVIGAVVVVLLASGWFAWPYLRPHLPFLNQAGEESATAQAEVASKAAEPNAPGTEGAAPPPVKEMPMTAPTHTLDVHTAKISEGKVNGSIGGASFVPDTIRFDKGGGVGVYVLDLRQGVGATPDRGLRVYLRLNPTESPTGRTWTVSQDLKGTPISQVVKVWKPNPKYAAQEKSFNTGFALKLEFGQLTESNTISGKIYAALPDKEQTVVAGIFNANSTLGASGTATPPPVAPTPQADMSPEFQRRYGIQR